MKKKLSKVEVKGIEAIFYDKLMMILSGFTYDSFIKKAIADMEIKRNDKILDLGSGSGKNLCIINKYTDNLTVGFDIGKEMLTQSKKRCRQFENVRIFYHDIRKPSPFTNIFDKAFISFVLHGFIDSNRDKIIKNAYNSLSKGGKFFILDYNEFDITKKNPIVQAVFKYGECPLASEFIKIDLKEKLKKFGFGNFDEKYYYSNLVRLLVCEK
jgi:ubiquinone/menaquinone biosynthesis C-methylase UbiE